MKILVCTSYLEISLMVMASDTMCAAVNRRGRRISREDIAGIISPSSTMNISPEVVRGMGLNDDSVSIYFEDDV